MNKIIILLFSLISFNSFSQNVRLIIKDNQTKDPIKGATAIIKKYNENKISDDNGKVLFEKLPFGRFEIEINSVGYTPKLIKELLLESSKDLIIEVNLEVSVKNLDEITISAASDNLSSAIVGVNAITTEQIFRFPATFFDPARLAFSFPGVANTNDQANGMSIRGNSPDGLQWRLEGVEIVNPNHLSNAGTFSDRPTQTGGGTNILSAQMLGNMNFLTGAFPADYANALSGVMDMRFRVGNNQKHEHTVQIGLIGLDLSSEGPLNKKKGSSYLFNYRYSFTGILGLMGVDFGGESIKFQDLALNLNFPTRKLGTFSIFAMGGNSANQFKPDENSDNWESEKDFSNIDFHSRMGVIGLKHTLKFKRNWNITNVVANSGLENLRNTYTTNPALNLSYDYQAKNIFSFSSVVNGKIKGNLNLRTGVNVSHFFNEFNFANLDDAFFSYDELIVQPFIKFTNNSQSKLNFNIGTQVVNYSLSGSTFLEPRVALAYRIGNHNRIKLAYGLHSQQSNSRFAFAIPYQPIRSHHFSIGNQINLKNGDEISGEIFYQNLFNAAVFTNPLLSVFNGLDDFNFEVANDQSDNKNQARNYGIELNYKKFLNKGLFALINTTLYSSEFRSIGNKFTPTRFSGNHIVNITLGKEWEKTKGRIIGLNTRIVWLGGFRSYEINESLSQNSFTTQYNYNKPLINKNPDFFRPDLRVYFKKSKTKYARTISLDIQNFINQKNLAFEYYDSLLKQVISKNQMGMIPMINYRIEF
jgi:hypothetical protein